jgi:hypothetical protein
VGVCGSGFGLSLGLGLSLGPGSGSGSGCRCVRVQARARVSVYGCMGVWVCGCVGVWAWFCVVVECSLEHLSSHTCFCGCTASAVGMAYFWRPLCGSAGSNNTPRPIPATRPKPHHPLATRSGTQSEPPDVLHDTHVCHSTWSSRSFGMLEGWRGSRHGWFGLHNLNDAPETIVTGGWRKFGGPRDSEGCSSWERTRVRALVLARVRVCVCVRCKLMP